eukprot:gene4693-9301_t
MAGAIDKDAELHGVLTGDPTVRAQRRDKERQKAWLSELIRFKRLDDEGNLQKGCEWRVARRRCNREFLQKLVDNCPLPCQIDYVFDNGTSSIQIEDIIKLARTDPVYYVFAPKIDRKPKDIIEDPRYSGQTLFVIYDVPLRSLDGIQVDAIAIREWLLAGTAEIDPKSAVIYDDIIAIKEKIVQVEKKIKTVPKIDIRDKRGELLPDDQANEERQNLYNYYNDEKIAIQKVLAAREEDLEFVSHKRKKMKMNIYRADIDEVKDCGLWHVQLFGDDADLVEDLLIGKTDWHDINLSMGNATQGLPPWAGRNPIPNGVKPEEPDYTVSLVHMQEARLARVAHGLGTYKELDQKKTNISSDKFSMYYGDWDLGRKNGHGISIDDRGIYSGRHVDDRRRGYGTLDLANGTTITGNFGVKLQHTCHVEGEFENPYLEGEPIGEVEVLFSDGSMFKGNIDNGKINKKGEYQSGFGEVSQGDFSNGILDGIDCYRKNHYGEEYRGRFSYGDIDGYGQYKNKHNNSYLGYWRYGMRHGRGIEGGNINYAYRGYFINDYRCGKGELQFNRKKENIIRNARLKLQEALNEHKDKEEESELLVSTTAIDTLSKFTNVFQGAMVNTESQTLRTVSKLDPILDPIKKQNIKNEKRGLRTRRRVNKFIDLENFIRSEMERKKWKMFRQQRHFTKKTMFQEDMEGGIYDNEVKARLNLRQDRLDKMNLDRHIPTKALVPRLAEMVTNEPSQRFQESFDRLQLDPYIHIGVDNTLAKMAVSNFDEFCERQRFIKYDKLWERAEAAYAERKRGIAALFMCEGLKDAILCVFGFYMFHVYIETYGGSVNWLVCETWVSEEP